MLPETRGQEIPDSVYETENYSQKNLKNLKKANQNNL